MTGTTQGFRNFVGRLPRPAAKAVEMKRGPEVSTLWPPTSWPRPLKLVAAGAISAAISTAAVSPLEQLRLKLIVGSYGARGGATRAFT